MRRKFVCLVLLGLLVVGLFPVVFVGASGESWLDGWGFRKSHSLTGSSGAGADYQVMVTVDYGSGSDSGDTVYVDGECETDFDDIRFTDDDGDTLLDYWLEDKSDGDFAVFWVEVADDLDDNQLVYVYYGNSEAESLSDGEATFPFFDDFNDASLDGAKWNEWLSSGSYSEAGGELHLVGGASGYEIIVAKTEFNQDVAFRGRIKWDEQNRVQWGADDRCPLGTQEGSGVDSVAIRYHVDRGKDYDTGDEGFHEFDARASDLASYTVLEITWGSGSVKYYESGSLKATHGVSRYPEDDMGIMFATYGATTDEYCDWTLVRKFTATEPSHGSWGSEEEAESDGYPQYQDVGDDGESEVGASVGVFCNWTDDLSLDTCYFSTNTSGVWVNSSLSVSGVQSWANTSFILNYTAGILVQYKWYCCDNATQWNVTSAYSITTVGLDYGEGGGDVFQFKPWFGFVGAIGFLSVCVFFGVIVIYKKR